MSASIYGVKKWCILSPKEITDVVYKVSVGGIYSGKRFYDEVEKMDGWADPAPDDDSVMIWSGDDAGPISKEDPNTGLFVHYDEAEQKFDWACLYEA